MGAGESFCIIIIYNLNIHKDRHLFLYLFNAFSL